MRLLRFLTLLELSFLVPSRACGRSSELALALETLFGMPKRRLQPDVVSYNTVLSCCAAVCDQEAAKRVLEEMPRWALKGFEGLKKGS